jgi:hypothetical protein
MADGEAETRGERLCLLDPRGHAQATEALACLADQSPAFGRTAASEHDLLRPHQGSPWRAPPF